MTDETAAFQKALTLMSEAQGGIVFVPRGISISKFQYSLELKQKPLGLFRFNGNIVIPPAVTLEGVFK